MPETTSTRADHMAWMMQALHDLAQPLTALECRLEVGLMEADAQPEHTAAALRAAVQEALAECQKAMARMRAIQQRLGM